MSITQYTAISKNYKINRKSDSNTIVNHGTGIFSNEVMDAKIFKILGHKFYPKSEILIWHDANIFPKISPDNLVAKYLGYSDVCFVKHPYRDCIYKEFNAIRESVRLKDIHKKSEIQEYYYKHIVNHPVNNGLFECNFFIRRNSPDINAMFESWWAEICRWTYRDQVSLPVILNNTIFDFNLKIIDLHDIRCNSDFEYINHY